jgi:hypothetical protein
MRVYKNVSMLIFSLLFCGGNVGGAGENRVQEGLSASDWSGIRGAYEANRHAVFAVDGGYQARNPGQQWRTRFDGRGFVTTPDSGGWSWGLELVGFGRDGAERAVSMPVCVDAVGQRVEYQWDDNLTEWYVNDGHGLEHGYTVWKSQKVETSKSQNGDLRIEVAVRGELQARVSGEGRSVTFVDKSGAAVVNYGGLKVIDATGAGLSAWFEHVAGIQVTSPEPQAFRVVVDDAEAVYPLTIDPIAQQAYLKASNTDELDYFGYSVAVSGDTVVVATPYEDSSATGIDGNQTDNSATDSGAAYVFVRNGTTWSQQGYLKASNTAADDLFGNSVAVSSDTIVVGAHGEDSIATGVNGNQADNSASVSGAAYVFVRSGGVWSQQAYLKASNTEAGDVFGYKVALSGDTIVVGAAGEDSSATGVNGNQANNSADASGAAYVFVRNGGVWSQQAYLKASNTGINDHFGSSVAVWDDTVVIGALFEDSGATGVNGNQADNSASASGAAYVFVRSGTTWSQQAYLKASNTGADDWFGYSVDVSGNTVVVGAFHEDSSATGVNGNQLNNSAVDSGAAYIFARSPGAPGVWSQQAYLKASNTGGGGPDGDFFGTTVAVSGDIVIVGANQEDSSATGVNGNQADNSAFNSGAAYVFVRSPGAQNSWSQQAYMKATNTGGGDNFGISVAVSGATMVIGAYGERSSAIGVDGNQTNNSVQLAGAAYVFLIPADLDGDGVLNSADACPNNTLGLPVDGIGRPLSDLNSDCNVNGLDVQTYINNPSVRPIEEFVVDLLQ